MKPDEAGRSGADRAFAGHPGAAMGAVAVSAEGRKNRRPGQMILQTAAADRSDNYSLLGGA